jgi:hypothetical protein
VTGVLGGSIDRPHLRTSSGFIHRQAAVLVEVVSESVTSNEFVYGASWDLHELINYSTNVHMESFVQLAYIMASLG